MIPDEVKNCGPLGGIYSCLKKSETDWNFVMSVDSAFVEPAFIEYLLTNTGDFDAVVPFHDKGKEPTIALYRKSSLGEMEKMIHSKNYKMHQVLNSIHTKLLNVQDWVEKYPYIFRNLNFPEDLNSVQ